MALVAWTNKAHMSVRASRILFLIAKASKEHSAHDEAQSIAHCATGTTVNESLNLFLLTVSKKHFTERLKSFFLWKDYPFGPTQNSVYCFNLRLYNEVPQRFVFFWIAELQCILRL